MAKNRDLKRGFDQLKRGIKRAVEEARAGSGGASGSAHHVNVAGRANVVVAKNVGREGSSHAASSTQRVRIRQNGDETYEETETITSNS